MSYGGFRSWEWQSWDGRGYEPATPGCVVFYCESHADLDFDGVLRALATSILREGVITGLGKVYEALEDAHWVHGFSGEVEGEVWPDVCDEHGETTYGEEVVEVIATTFVEVPDGF